MSNKKSSMSADPYAGIRLADVRFSEKEKQVDVIFELIEEHQLLAGSQVLLELTRSIDYRQSNRPSYEQAVQTASLQLGEEFIQISKTLHKIAEEHSPGS